MTHLSPVVPTVSGANRPNGLGFHLARQLAQLPDSLVFAAVRNPPTATQLAALASERDNVIVVKLDVTSEADAQEAAKMVKERAGKVDVLIPCAGSLPSPPVVAEFPQRC